MSPIEILTFLLFLPGENVNVTQERQDYDYYDADQDPNKATIKVNGKTFFVPKTSGSFKKMREECQKQGGDIAEDPSYAEMKAITDVESLRFGSNRGRKYYFIPEIFFLPCSFMYTEYVETHPGRSEHVTAKCDQSGSEKAKRNQ